MEWIRVVVRTSSGFDVSCVDIIGIRLECNWSFVFLWSLQRGISGVADKCLFVACRIESGEALFHFLMSF